MLSSVGMTTLTSNRVVVPRVQAATVDTWLLVCGILSSIAYVAANVLAGLSWDGYSFSAQTISELSAIDAPSRSVWMPIGAAYGVLLLAFGVGVWRVSRRAPRLRATAALLIVIAVFGAFWPPMHLRGAPTSLTDTLHVVWAVVVSVLILLAIGIGALDLGRRFRIYSGATLAAMLVAGGASFWMAPDLAANLPTPYLGLVERINLGLYLGWVAVLAVALLRTRSPHTAGGEYVRLGGVDQWVMIRGEDVANPPLVMLHGGPGFSETTFFRYFNAALEKGFTVVYWDQRGAGKSFDPEIPRSSMTVERFLADLDELVDLVRERLGTPKVAIFGHSWGTVLGAVYAARFPEKVSVYVASGQVGAWNDGELRSYDYALETAERTRNRGALKALRAIGRPPRDAGELMRERTWVQRMDGQLSLRMFWQMARMIAGTKEASFLELTATYRAFRFTLDAMWSEVSKLNLLDPAPVLTVPTFFFIGRKDHWIPAEASLAYIDALTAPSKEVVWFDESGHETFADEPAKFNATMLERVRPAAVAGGGS
jgi:pimeloyl-ACP methyl ester carboxylesterase